MTNKIDTQPLNLIGFGEHSQPVNYSTYKNSKIIYDIAIALLITGVAGTLVTVGLIIFPIASIGLTSASTMIAFAASSGVFTAGAITSVIYYRGCKNAFKVLNNIASKIDPPLALGQPENCDAMACEDTIESFEWKKKLIKAANHNIVLSGNYCGGITFEEVLDLIKEQMKKKKKLKVILLSSDHFINENHIKRIKNLQQAFDSRFEFIDTPDIYHINPGFKKTTNHVKVLAIDYGKYFMLGGSGLEDKYALAKGLGDRKSQKATKVGGLIGLFLPRGFRDQDFIFHSNQEQGIGKRLYVESLKLALRWTYLNQLTHGRNTRASLAGELKKGNSITKSLLLNEKKGKKRKQHFQSLAYLPELHQHSKYVQQCSTKIYCTGPEHNQNPFEKEIIHQFSKAKKRIIINHMYFHPTKDVMKALIKAANKGVNIKIITNGYKEGESPAGHQFYGPRNRYNYCELRNSIQPACRKNLTIFEFKVRKTTLHKKIMVVDDYVIGGNSNLGYKSFVTMSDHEINFVTKNKKLADQTAKIAEIDARVDYMNEKGLEIKGYARKVNNFQPRLFTILSAARHRIFAPLIG